MTNNSSTGDYLSPGAAMPDDSALDAILQGYVVGIVGLAGQYVRPRWQPTVPKQPPASVDWCAIGVTETDREPIPAIIHSAAGTDTLYRNEVMSVLASFYGPDAKRNAALLADGMQIPQNTEVIGAFGLALVDSGRITAAPELINETWFKRYDMSFRLRRQVAMTYQVLNALSAQVGVEVENRSSAINVTQ